MDYQIRASGQVESVGMEGGLGMVSEWSANPIDGLFRKRATRNGSSWLLVNDRYHNISGLFSSGPRGIHFGGLQGTELIP